MPSAAFSVPVVRSICRCRAEEDELNLGRMRLPIEAAAQLRQRRDASEPPLDISANTVVASI